MALGAPRLSILTRVLRNGIVLAAIGLVLGFAGASALSGVMRGLLFEVQPVDPAVFAAVGAMLFIVTAAACLIPAWRATRVNPVETLRYESCRTQLDGTSERGIVKLGLQG